jgi:imidazolonepropionase-like amidohydrolase
MKRSAFLFLLFCCVAALGVSSPANTGRIWISDVSIISPENLDHISVGSVLIDGGRIVRVERGATALAPAGARVISGNGKFLIPGLIDSHVHLASIPGVQPDELFHRRKALPEMFRQYFEQLPRSYLYFGYTTLIDLAVVDRSVLDNFRQAPLHPDLYDCGPSLPVANGYPMSFAPPEVRFQLFPNWLLDPQHTSHLPAGYDPKQHTPAAAVAEVKRSGGICVKTYFERGFGRDRNLPVITPALIAQVRQAAHQDNLVLMMHANSFEAQKFAVDAQVDVIAHGMWNWGDLDKSSELPAEIKTLLDRIVTDKIGYQPTIQVMEGLRAYFDLAYLQMPAVGKVVPAKLLAWFNSPDGKWFKKEVSQQSDDGKLEPDAAMREGYDRGPIRRVDQVVAYLAAKNARFLFGTDTPSAPTYGNLPGLNGYLEMQDLHRAGMSLPQILRAATIDNARMFHLDSQLGTIEPGKIANLVLLRKSPLESVDAFNSIVAVFVHGKPIFRDSLAAAN